MSDAREKIALFGGTFDPVHNAHLVIAPEAQKSCRLDRVVFVPCWKSPHKQERKTAAAEHRLAMLRLATAGLPWAEVSDWEITRSEPSYSWATAEHFAGAFPECDLHWILGADQWNVIGTWARPERLAELLTFIVFPRNGIAPVAHAGFRRQFLQVETPGSSTEVRRRASQGQSVAGLVPPPVADYIATRALY